MKNLQYFPYERNQYYYGKLITQQDFISEQKYMNDKRRLINRFLHGVGVASGLQAVEIDERTISVEAGVALDGVGREIVLADPVVVRLNQIEGYQELKETYTESGAYLCIAYDERDVYPTKDAMSPDGGETQAYEKTQEGYKLYLTTRELDDKSDTVISMAVNTVLLFENEDLTIYQEIPTFVETESTFNVSIIIIDHHGAHDCNITLSESLTCASCSGEDRLELNWLGHFDKAGETKVINAQLQAFPLERGHVQLHLQKSDLTVNISGKCFYPLEDIEMSIPVSAKSKYEQLLTRYYRDSMTRVLANSYPKGIYLARLYLTRCDDDFVIDTLERMPFDQYVYNTFVSMGLIGRLITDVTDLKRAAAGTGEGISAPAAGASAPAPIRKEASGICTLDLGLGGVAGDRFFSEEIVHGLGLGRVQIELSIDGDTIQYFGSSEIFKNMEIRAELAARADNERGCFVIGMRLLEATAVGSVNIRWTARLLSEDKTTGTDQRIVITPGKLEMKVMQNRYLRARTENLTGMTLTWEVRSPHGGTISRDGLYTAPGTEGVYEVGCYCSEMPQIRSSIYVIVRR